MHGAYSVKLIMHAVSNLILSRFQANCKHVFAYGKVT